MFTPLKYSKPISKIFTLVSCLFAFIVIFSTVFSPITTQAKSEDVKVNKKDKKELTVVLDRVTKSDPIKPEKAKIKQDSLNKEFFKSNQGNLNIDFDLKTKKINLKNQVKGDTIIGIPNTAEIDSVDVLGDTIMYSGKNLRVDTIIEPINRGFRQIINIKSAEAPSSYDFPIELLVGEKLVVNEDGSARVTRPFNDYEKAKNFI